MPYYVTGFPVLYWYGFLKNDAYYRLCNGWSYKLKLIRLVNIMACINQIERMMCHISSILPFEVYSCCPSCSRNVCESVTRGEWVVGRVGVRWVTSFSKSFPTSFSNFSTWLCTSFSKTPFSTFSGLFLEISPAEIVRGRQLVNHTNLSRYEEFSFCTLSFWTQQKRNVECWIEANTSLELQIDKKPAVKDNHYQQCGCTEHISMKGIEQTFLIWSGAIIVLNISALYGVELLLYWTYVPYMEWSYYCIEQTCLIWSGAIIVSKFA
jgi:hypothetical protein